jgi:sugar/nucleoside kinase (ribokinase family)
MTFDVLGIGEHSIDSVYRVPRLPHGGGPDKLPISSARVFAGGQVATTLCTCTALGLSASYVGAFGTDGNGRLIRDTLARHGVDTSRAIVCDGTSRYAVILVDEATGERLVLWHRDAAVVVPPAAIDAAVIGSARLLHVDATDEALAIHAATLARRAGVPVTSDIDRATPRTRELMAAVTVPIFGAGVPEALTGEPTPECALRALRREHEGLLCATHGAQGAMLLEGDTLHTVPAHTVDAVDTTGAGDVFRGAFIHALLRGKAPADILAFANAAAAVSCTREGAIDSVPTLTDVERLLATARFTPRSPNVGT